MDKIDVAIFVTITGFAFTFFMLDWIRKDIKGVK